MIKKVVVSAAGQGTRMLSLSEYKSKHLINVQDKPFLAYLLDNIFEAGYQEVILVVGFKKDLMEKFVEQYQFKGAKQHITIVSQFEKLGPREEIYGTACPLMCVKDLVENENFVSLVGDNFYTVEDLKVMNVDDDVNYVAGRESQHPEKYGVLIEKDGCLEKIIEKPKEFVGNLINTSLYKFTPNIFKKVFEIEKSPRGEYEITDAISLLAQDRKVKVKKIHGFWMDFGRPEDVEKFSKFLKDENTESVK